MRLSPGWERWATLWPTARRPPSANPAAERSDPNYRAIVLERRLRRPLVALNPDLPPEALEDAYRMVTRSDAPSLVERTRALHRMLVDGVTGEYRRIHHDLSDMRSAFAYPDRNPDRMSGPSRLD